jgi:hypothetical protein
MTVALSPSVRELLTHFDAGQPDILEEGKDAESFGNGVPFRLISIGPSKQKPHRGRRGFRGLYRVRSGEMSGYVRVPVVSS